ncbi:HAMP domain-containing sensor histidine kinase [soil metagenome]
MSLRARLITAVTVLMLGVIALFGFVAVSSQRRVLLAQVDDRIAFALEQPVRRNFDRPRGGGDRLLAEVVLNPEGEVVASAPSGIEGEDDPLPTTGNLPTPPVGQTHLLTVPASGATPAFRVGVRTFPRGFRLVVAQPLDEISAASRALRSNLILAGLVILLAGAGAVWLTVRRGLRPVDEMIETASAIADGDLSRRVASTEPETELGKLGSALNHMLANIEGAFHSEARANERLKQSVADTSHELRTPLAAIAGYSELHRKGALEDDGATERAMSRIEAESRRMTHLVEDLLLLARLDLDQAPKHQRVELRVLVEDAAADSRAIDPERSVSVNGSSRVFINGDQEQLTQVATNLLANARVHTPPGTPIEIDLLDHENEVELAVTDHGPGFKPEALESVFDRFYRADNSRSRKSGGAGLGLAIVAAIARARVVRAIASNVTGVGARVAVVLPRTLG